MRRMSILPQVVLAACSSSPTAQLPVSPADTTSVAPAPADSLSPVTGARLAWEGTVTGRPIVLDGQAALAFVGLAAPEAAGDVRGTHAASPDGKPPADWEPVDAGAEIKPAMSALGVMCLHGLTDGVGKALDFTWQAVADLPEAAGRAHADGTPVFARNEGDCIERLEAGADAAKRPHDLADHIAALLPPRAGSRP